VSHLEKLLEDAEDARSERDALSAERYCLIGERDGMIELKERMAAELSSLRGQTDPQSNPPSTRSPHPSWVAQGVRNGLVAFWPWHMLSRQEGQILGTLFLGPEMIPCACK